MNVLFALHGILCDMPSVAVLFHLETLGYSIAQISLIDSGVNGAWAILCLFRGAPLLGAQVLGVAMWLALAVAPPPELFMTLSESAVAMHQAVLEERGLEAAAIRSKLVGKVIGALLGGALLHRAGFRAVYVLQAAVFCAAVVVGLAVERPRVTVTEARPDPNWHFIAFMTLQAVLPDPGNALFFYYSDSALGRHPHEG